MPSPLSNREMAGAYKRSDTAPGLHYTGTFQFRINLSDGIGIDAKIEKITDIGQIAMHGILSTPGLIVNGKIKHSGKPLPSLDKVKDLIKSEA